MKKLFLSLFCICLCLNCFSENYKIQSVNYHIEGKTKESAIKREIEIDKNRIFFSEEELTEYILDLEVRFKNERNFKNAKVEYHFILNDEEKNENSTEIKIEDEKNENGEVIFVEIDVFTEDSSHLIVLPYPKYSSSTGLTVKAKLRDSNTFGTLSELNSEIFFANEKEDEESLFADKKIGFQFDYDYPFAVGPFNAKFLNNYEVEYTINKNYPEYDLLTGLFFELPFKNFAIDFLVTQRAFADFEYLNFDDNFVGTTTAELSFPITVANIKNWGKCVLSPYAKIKSSYDSDGINVLNYDLTGPVLSGGLKFSTSRVNWINNFRNGLSVDFDGNYGWNFQNNDHSPFIEGSVTGFKAFKYFALSGRVYGVWQKYTQTEIGEELRGISDVQKYATGFVNQKALKVNSAFVINFDMPIHLFSIDWTKVTDNNFMKKMGFEVQASPFIDIALTSNKVTNRSFDLRDGFYTAGFEILVYPEHWRSLVLRGSLGFDLSRTAFKNYVDMSWRKPIEKVKPYEIFIGLGLSY